jgi:RNA polymerase sigma factor (sigma-70 family)
MVNAIFRQHRAKLLAFANKLTRNRADAEDLLQKTFLHMWTYRHHLEGQNERNLIKLFMVSMRRLHWETVHKPHGHNRLELVSYDAVPVHPGSDERSAEKALGAQQVVDLMMRDHMGRIAVWRGQGFSNIEIAAELGTSSKSVESSFRRAKKKYMEMAVAA